MAATDWKEVIAPNERELFDGLAAQLREVQREKAKSHGNISRGLHAYRDSTVERRVAKEPTPEQW